VKCTELKPVHGLFFLPVIFANVTFLSKAAQHWKKRGAFLAFFFWLFLCYQFAFTWNTLCSVQSDKGTQLNEHKNLRTASSKDDCM